MWPRISYVDVFIVVLVGLVSAEALAGTAGKEILPGDKLIVKTGPAPVKDGDKTLTTVNTGTTLVAYEVDGDRVKVAVTVDGKRVQGWIDRANVKLASAIGDDAPDPDTKAPDKPKKPKEPKEGKVTIVMHNMGKITLPVDILVEGEKVRHSVPVNGLLKIRMDKGFYSVTWGRIKEGTYKTPTLWNSSVDNIDCSQRWIFVGSEHKDFYYWERKVLSLEEDEEPPPKK